MFLYTTSALQEIPGRLWDGKEVVLDALGCLVAAEPHCVQPEENIISALLGESPLVVHFLQADVCALIYSAPAHQ